MAGLYLDTSAPVAADTIAASSPISTAVAHAAQIVPVGLAALNEDKTPDGAKTVSGSCYGTFSDWLHGWFLCQTISSVSTRVSLWFLLLLTLFLLI